MRPRPSAYLSSGASRLNQSQPAPAATLVLEDPGTVSASANGRGWAFLGCRMQCIGARLPRYTGLRDDAQHPGGHAMTTKIFADAFLDVPVRMSA